MPLKEYKQGEPIPDDFWNYNINIILGYALKRERSMNQETQKYGITPKGDI